MNEKQFEQLRESARQRGVVPALVDGELKFTRDRTSRENEYMAMADFLKELARTGRTVEPDTLRILPDRTAPQPKAAKPAAAEAKPAPVPDEYVGERLSEMPVKELRAIADGLGVGTGLKKADLVKAILRARK